MTTKRFHVPWRMDDGREARPHRGSLDPRPFEGGSLEKVSLWCLMLHLLRAISAVGRTKAAADVAAGV